MSMFCTECGAEIKEGAQFCGKCGTSIASTEETEIATSAPSAKNVQSPPLSSPSKKEIFYGAVKAALIRGDISTPVIINKRNSGENNNNILLCDDQGIVISRIPIDMVLETIKEQNLSGRNWDKSIIKSWERDSNQTGDYAELERSRRNNNNSSYKDSGLIRAFKIRQRDTSWGYAFACTLLPFVGIYYGISRRTITPFLNVLLGSWILGFSVGIVAAVANPDIDEDAIGGLMGFTGFISCPFLCKKGIDDARKYAKNRLEKMT